MSWKLSVTYDYNKWSDVYSGWIISTNTCFTISDDSNPAPTGDNLKRAAVSIYLGEGIAKQLGPKDTELAGADSDPDLAIQGRYEVITINEQGVSFTNASSGQDVSQYQTTKQGQEPENASTVIPTAEPSVGPIPADGSQDVRQESENVDDVNWHSGWDPRMYRYDEYFVFDWKNGGESQPIRIPFASQSAVTAFSDQTGVMESGLIAALVADGAIDASSYIAQQYQGINLKETNDENSDAVTLGQFGSANNSRANMPLTEKDIPHDVTEYENDNKNWGVQSIMNPYSITKLVGGLAVYNKGSEVINYMYDIRDHRRFYSMQESGDVLSISNPTVAQLIQWSNADQWGRTPYSFQDFVYCKHFGLIPNNRLITLRRYAVPTYDNLQFESMTGKIETTTEDSSGNKMTEQKNQNDGTKNNSYKTFSPVAYVVTWFGGDTGNSLNSLMSFTTGIKWGKVEANIWDVTGEQGESKQAVIDRMLGDGDHTGLFHPAELGSLNSVFEFGSMVTAKMTSLGKFHLALNGKIGQTQKAYDNLASANVDPYDSTFKNRVRGPINRIDSVKKRDPGIEFSQSLTIKCSYKAKAIGGINPKAALLDVLGNCMEMVSPHAVFWGGGHRFMVKPKLYPFHDGGWRDNFMAKIYDGKILGKDGAIAAALSGLKKIGTGDGGGDFNWDTAKDVLGGLLKSAGNLIGGAISSISDMFGGLDLFENVANKFISGDTPEEKAAAKEKAKGKINNLFNNLNNMWHNRMMEVTMMPHINGGGNILVGEPVGEWHLTIGNPLNPIMVIGNLICNNMKVTWDDELGPDDFPTGFTVEYSLDHAMARDSDAIQSMFNRGMGKFYSLPDYINLSSDKITYVDKFTKNAGKGDTGRISFKSSTSITAAYGSGNQVYKISPGHKPSNSGTYKTSLITKFTPLNSEAQRSIIDRRDSVTQTMGMARVRSLSATRKHIGN